MTTVKGVRTSQGNAQIDYDSLANKPTINGTELQGDVALASIGASPTSHTHTAAAVGAVPTSRTVNGKALSANIDIGIADINGLDTRLATIESTLGTQEGTIATVVPATRKIGTKTLEQDITLEVSDISGLQDALDGKAASSHTHSAYAASSHTHNISSINVDSNNYGTSAPSSLTNGQLYFVYE